MLHFVIRWLTRCIALPSLVTTVGCSTYHYQITLRPDGEALERELTCWREATYQGTPRLANFPSDALAKIAAAYEAEPSAKLDQKHTFKGRFVGAMPVDLDNNGTYTHWTSPLGSVSHYTERFGGNDDAVAQIEERRKASHRLIELAIGWLETELGKEPNWQNLRGYLDTKVRHDIENLSYMILLEYDPGRSVDDGPSQERFGREMGALLARVLQYLVEQGYVDLRELPKFFGPNTESALLEWSDRFVGRGLGLADDAPRPKAMDFLKSSHAARVSWNRFLQTTPEYHRLLDEWRQKEKAATADLGVDVDLDEDLESIDDNEPSEWLASPPRPEDVLGEILAPFFKLNLKDPKKIEVVLACGEPPIATNGVWDESKRAVTWKRERNEGQGLPTHLYATWSQPDRPAQQERFGSLVLTGDRLGRYVMWYAGLTKAQTAEWDSFLATLRPGPDLIPAIETFRFSFDPQRATTLDEPKPPSAADVARQLILEGIPRGPNEP